MTGQRLSEIGVVGAGTMGTGIAIVSARAGLRTLLFDTNEAALQSARSKVECFLKQSVERGKLDSAGFERAMSCLIPCARMDALAHCSLIIEAVFEHRSVKIELLQHLDRVCAAHTIFASNTSTLSITELAGACSRPDRVVGLHFCLPAERMRLVEVTPALTTSASTLSAAVQFCERTGQHPVITQDRPGFILNALAIPLNNSAIRLVEAGTALPASIDTALKLAYGHAMGPLELTDLVGLDTQIRLSEALYPQTADFRALCPPLLRRMVAAKRLGSKSGGGFHQHFPEGRPAPAMLPVEVFGKPLHGLESISAAPVAFIREGHLPSISQLGPRKVIIHELGRECLSMHTRRARYPGDNPTIGFAPYHDGSSAAPRVVELVVSAQVPDDALAAALGLAQTLSLHPVICRDRPGRIIDRLIRPYLNDALRGVEEGWASAADFNSTVRMGLGYREGPLELLRRCGFHYHKEVSRSLHAALGEPAYLPAHTAGLAVNVPE